MYRNLDSETSKKLDRALANKIKVKRFVTRQEADAIKAALGKKDEIRKRTTEKDQTSSILKRLDRVDIEKLMKHPGHPDQRVHSPTGRAAIAREKKPEGVLGRTVRETAENLGLRPRQPKTPKIDVNDESFAEPLRVRGVNPKQRQQFAQSSEGQQLARDIANIDTSGGDTGEQVDRLVTSHYTRYKKKKKKKR